MNGGVYLGKCCNASYTVRRVGPVSVGRERVVPRRCGCGVCFGTTAVVWRTPICWTKSWRDRMADLADLADLADAKSQEGT